MIQRGSLIGWEGSGAVRQPAVVAHELREDGRGSGGEMSSQYITGVRVNSELLWPAYTNRVPVWAVLDAPRMRHRSEKIRFPEHVQLQNSGVLIGLLVEDAVVQE